MTKQFLRLLLVVGFLLNVQSLFAVCGTTDYSGGSGRLYDIKYFVLVLCYYTSLIVETLAGILSIYSATQIYIKMNTGEDGITKSILVLVGAILFLLGSVIVLPSFFGVGYGSGAFKYI